MNALGEFIQEQMDARGWRQIHLVRHSGLTKQRVSRLLGDRKLHRMIAPVTVTGLAKAFGIEESVIRLKAAEAMGGEPVNLAVITVPRRPTEDEIVAVVLRALRGGEQSDLTPAPNPRRAVDDAGDAGEQVSGEAGTRGDLRDPWRRSHGSDDPLDDKSAERYTDRHAV